MIKKILIEIGIVSIFMGLVYLRRCPNRQQKVSEQQDYAIEEKTYHRPIINIPFLAPKPPVAKELLPIPSHTIKKTIAVISHT